MSEHTAVDPQAPEAGLPEAWREHVHELRAENARRRKDNHDLRAQLAGLSERADEASGRAEREASRLSTVHRRLKELEVTRLARDALHGVAASRAEGAVSVDVSRAQRLLERVPAPVDLDADLTVDDEGRVALQPDACDRLKSFVAELADLVSVEQHVAPPPVGGEPPRPSEPSGGPVANAWAPDGQRSPVGRARARLRHTARQNARALGELTQL